MKRATIIRGDCGNFLVADPRGFETDGANITIEAAVTEYLALCEERELAPFPPVCSRSRTRVMKVEDKLARCPSTQRGELRRSCRGCIFSRPRWEMADAAPPRYLGDGRWLIGRMRVELYRRNGWGGVRVRKF